MALIIIKAGVRTLVQDLGFYGSHRIGLGISGALDERAYLFATYLLNNNNTNALEILLGNFKAKVAKDTNIAVTGADALVLHNYQPVRVWSRFPAKAGDIIEIKDVFTGNLNYLAVENGFQIPKFRDSYSTNFKLGLGSIGKLSNQTLAYQTAKLKNHAFINHKFIPKQYFENSNQVLKLNFILSYEATKLFQEKQIQKFLNNNYSISLFSDRMGIRLEGEAITPLKTDLESECLTFGTVQVPINGMPIILMKDCQTIGGYAKLGYISALDCFSLAQLRPKQKISFRLVEPNKSQQGLRKFYQFFKKC